jgi:hypothetical protein
MNINKFIEDNLDDILDNPEYFINEKKELNKEENHIETWNIIDNTNEDNGEDEYIIGNMDYEDFYELKEKQNKIQEENIIEDSDYYFQLLNLYIKYYNEKFNKNENLFYNIKNIESDTNSALELFFEAIIEFKHLKDKLNLDEIDLLDKYYKENDNDNEIINLMNSDDQVYCLEIENNNKLNKIITFSLIICLNYVLVNKINNWKIFILKDY